MAAKRKKITVLMGEAEFEKFDLFCQKRGFKKSTLLVWLLREFLKKEAGQVELSSSDLLAKISHNQLSQS